MQSIKNKNDLMLHLKIAWLKRKSNKYKESSSWARWYSVEDDIAELYSQTTMFQVIIKRVAHKLGS